MRLVIASDSAEERRAYRQAALDAGLACEADDCVSVAALPKRLQRGGVDAALASVGLDESKILGAVHRAGAVPLYAVCDSADDRLVPTMLRAGARGYVRRSAVAKDLGNVASDLEAGTCPVSRGQLIAVVGGQHGVGVTTIATNLAFAAASRAPGQVALVQIVDGGGDLALHLGIQPEYPLGELAAGWSRLSLASLDRFLLKYSKGPSILAEQSAGASAVQWSAVALRHLLVHLRSRFAYVVADFGLAMDAARVDALRTADAVNVVLRLDVPTLEKTRQYVGALAGHGVFGEKLTGIVNFHGQSEEWPWTKARAALGLSIGGWIPDDSESVNAARNARKPLVLTARNKPIAASFERLAAQQSAVTRRAA
ncbi:MAG: CpaE family protein [Gemmataceae bacterium]